MVLYGCTIVTINKNVFSYQNYVLDQIRYD